MDPRRSRNEQSRISSGRCEGGTDLSTCRGVPLRTCGSARDPEVPTSSVGPGHRAPRLYLHLILSHCFRRRTSVRASEGLESLGRTRSFGVDVLGSALSLRPCRRHEQDIYSYRRRPPVSINLTVRTIQRVNGRAPVSSTLGTNTKEEQERTRGVSKILI